jgi:hypothetical protein
MELAFATRDLRTLCEDLSVAQDVLGTSVADQLKARLADMRAADNVEEFMGLGIPGVMPLDPDAVTVELSQGYRIVMRSNHEVGPRRPENAEEWRRVRRVQILSIDRDAG